jgi:hypothetical protein
MMFVATLARNVRRLAKGRWREVLHRVAGLSLAILDGKFHRCPKCKRPASFRLACNECGACECKACFPLPVGCRCKRSQIEQAN